MTILLQETSEPSAPNQLWETDMTYVWCDDKTWCYCFNVIDAFTRKWISYILAPTATADNALQAVLDALATIPEEQYDNLRIRMDNGSQYTSQLFKENMSTLGIKCEYIWVRTPQQNGHVESFHKTFKKEYLWPYELPNFQAAEKIIHAAFIDYNERRIHSSLGYLTPNEYIYLWKQAEEDTRK